MLRKVQISLLVVTLLAGTASLSHSYPQGDEQILMHAFWQNDSTYRSNIFGCQNNDTTCQAQRQGHTIWKYGCALTSMAMLYWAYGFYSIPDERHVPQYNLGNKLNPDTFNNYLAGRVDSASVLLFGPSESMRGFNSSYDFDFLKTTSNFYYYNETPGAYGIGLHNAQLVPNYDCTPIEIGRLRRNGSVQMLRRSASCFVTDWSDGAMTRLDYDLSWGGNYEPPIMKINYTKYTLNSEGETIDEEAHVHFVVIAGYEKKDRADDPGLYRAHNPAFQDNGDTVPKALNGITQYGQTDKYGSPLYSFDKMVRLYRFSGKYSPNPLNTIPSVYLAAHSPVEMQVIDPDGNLIGYDPDSGKSFLENAMSLYYEDKPITALDGTDMPSEPVKILSIAEAREGNYIFKIFGTGSGPYTIDVKLSKSDGSPSLITAFTGTATPSLADTYRISYSPSGAASISQANQNPLANAGANQTGEQSYEITLDGSASSDPDGDPLKYSWSFISRPPNSVAVISNSDSAKPTFTPDLPGTYVLQLVVNDYFTDSSPSTVTVTATPVISRIALTPSSIQPLNWRGRSIV